MLDLNKIMEMWEEDSKIDKYNLDVTARDDAVLHSKYLNLYNQARMNLKYQEQKMAIMLKEKWLYYNGKFDKAALDKRHWKYDPFDGMTTPLKSDMHYYFNSDPDMQELELKIEGLKVIRDSLKDIMDSVKWRSTTIKNIITWQIFTNGG